MSTRVLFAMTLIITACGPEATAWAEGPDRTQSAVRADSKALAANELQPKMRLLHTPAKTRFGLFGEKRDAPAPLVFVFATSVDDMDRLRIYSETGRQLASRGWLYATLDPPCHGRDHREPEPAGLAGWAHRVSQDEDLMAPFIKRCSNVLDYLIAHGYADPQQIAACGTSRGGFCALHFAAADARVGAVAAVSPVTNLSALREFTGVSTQKTRSLQVSGLAEKLAQRAVWLSIGEDDQRVGTTDCRETARVLKSATSRRRPGRNPPPVELVIGPTNGHAPIQDAYALAARFLLAHFSDSAER